jgi:pimeloyl-ACP methyl ester carboxylesterase
VTEPFTYWDSANDLAALLQNLGVERAVLVGMSQGGYLSLRAALAHPDLVQGLILIDTQAGTENPDLVIHGDHDAAIGVDRGEALAAGLPHARLVLIEGAGHASNLTHANLVNPHITRFLKELSS